LVLYKLYFPIRYSGRGEQPAGELALLHRYVTVRLVGQHGADHEGAGAARHVHGHEAPGDQPGPLDHPPAARARQQGQERQASQGSGRGAVRGVSAARHGEPGHLLPGQAGLG